MTNWTVSGPQGSGCVSRPFDWAQVADVSSVGTRCQVAGHHVGADTDALLYVDGVAVVSCDVCGVRIEIAKIPTGILLPWAKTLVERLMAEPLDNVLDDLQRFRAHAGECQDQLLELNALVKLIEGILAQRLCEPA